MSDPSNYELLSAYLDGELPPSERQHVERLLAEDADCRKVYEELLALRTSLADLPRHRLDEDLGPSVIRLAQEALRDKQEVQGEPLPASLQAADRRARRWRTIVYPLAVAAAAVVMLIAGPREKREQQMAQAPVKDAPPAAVSAAPPPAAEKHFATVQLDEVHSPRKAGEAGSALKSSQPAGGEDESTFDSDALAADEPAESDSRTPIALDPRMPAARPESIARQEELRLGRPRGLAGPAANGPVGALPPGSKATLVLECTLAPAAIRDKAFDLVLTRNHLSAVAAPAAAEAQLGDRKDVAYTIAKPAYEADEKTAGKDKARAKKQDEMGIAGAERHPPQDVLVELKPEQFVAILADLQNHPDQFLSVQLPPQAAAAADRAGAAPLFYAAPAAGKPQAPAANYTSMFSLPEAVAGSGPQPLLVLFRLSEAEAP